jgi:hypothetical protein
MIDAEVQRLGKALRLERQLCHHHQEQEQELSLPLLGKDANITSVVDTLQLLKSKKLWVGGSVFGGRMDEDGDADDEEMRRRRERRLPKPRSFKQSDLYKHVCNKPMPGAHNAMSDVLGHEDILMSDALRGWQELGDKLQEGLQLNVGFANLSAAEVNFNNN